MAVLESKLTVYKVCYQQAESKKDHKRMDKIGGFIDHIQDQIKDMKS
jgi:hypothetical protein